MRSAAVKRGNPNLARKLRRSGTDAERLFWSKVRNRQVDGLKFKRQMPVGDFIADFCCAELKVIVELDGGQHQNNSSDVRRTEVLERLGFRVVRFWNNDVLGNVEGVVDQLRAEISKMTPHPAR